MSKENTSKETKVGFLGYDPVEEPETIIASDKNEERKEAFKEAYKKVMKIIPEYFMTERKKRKNTASGTSEGGFSQSIIVTPENVKIETNVLEEKEEIQEEKENEKEIE